jgi:hypothetical protein
MQKLFAAGLLATIPDDSTGHMILRSIRSYGAAPGRLGDLIDSSNGFQGFRYDKGRLSPGGAAGVRLPISSPRDVYGPGLIQQSPVPETSIHFANPDYDALPSLHPCPAQLHDSSPRLNNRGGITKYYFTVILSRYE